ncbi:MAG: hypothetical protein NWS69_01035 [Pseudomonadales bacterium]|nr:hypothetical protein [Pseudomonadales bacterium]MDP4912468.1 hypothetical protein [Pseudomonadales bacterium]
MNSLTDDDISVLQTALDDEYHSWATYDQVTTDFGEARPFSHIRDGSLHAACEAGVAAETANGKMYERLISQTRQPDILAVLRNLQAASQQRHLVAFQRCLERLAAGRGGRGGPSGRGNSGA